MSSSLPGVPPAIAEGYTLRIGYPSIPAYRRLRTDSGLSPVTEEQASYVATGSWFGCYIEHDETSTPAAMGRILGDGGWYFHIADMATLPEHQRKGLGGLIMYTLLTYIKENAPSNAYVNLMADPPGWRLYEKAGFVDGSTRAKGEEKAMYMML